MSIKNYNGLTLVHFWASWCEPCIDELPELVQWVSQYDSKSIRLIAISLDQKWSDAETILSSLKIKSDVMTYLIDPDLKVAHSFGSFQYPETYLIYRNDKILTKWIGVQKWSDPYFTKIIKYFIEHPQTQ